MAELEDTTVFVQPGIESEPEEVDLFAYAQRLYHQLPSTPESPTRRKDLPFGPPVTITPIDTAEQQAFLFQVDGATFYLNADGVQWVSLPQIDVKIGLERKTLPLHNSIVEMPETGDQFSSIYLLQHVENRIQGKLTIFPPIGAKLANQ